MSGNEVVDKQTGEVGMEWTPQQIELIKNTVAPDATDDELLHFLYVAEKCGLDPLLRQLHMVKRWSKALGRKVATIQTGIDGYRVIADRSKAYAGQDAPEFAVDGDGLPLTCTITVYKMVEGQRCGVSATAYFDEYKQTTKEGKLSQFWAKMPFGQFAKCTEALALRKAFPADLSGIYTFEEMAQASNGEDEKKEYPKSATKAENLAGIKKCLEYLTDNNVDGYDSRVRLAASLQKRFSVDTVEEIEGSERATAKQLKAAYDYYRAKCAAHRKLTKKDDTP